MATSIQIHDYVSKTFGVSKDILEEIFDSPLLNNQSFAEVYTALASIPHNLVRDIATPVILSFFETLDLDPKKSDHRAQAAKFSGALAQAIFTTGNMYMSAINEQQQKKKSFASGIIPVR